MSTVVVTKDDHLGKFLCRPVNIYSTTLALSSGVGVSILPWYLWLNNSEIAYKLAGYARFRGNLKLTIICASTPFNYGLVRCSYKPLVNHVTDNSKGDYSGGSAPLVDSALNNIIISQRMGVDIHIGKDQSKDLILPFILYSDYIDISADAGRTISFQDMGRLYITSIAPPQTVSTSTTAVTLTILAEMQDIVLETPAYNTNALDEYEQAPVSTIATAVAEASGAAVQFVPPSLKPLAVATNVAARLASVVAKSFGYTSPSVLEPTIPVRPRLMGNQSNTFIPENYEPLSVDPKHAVSISSVDVGGSTTDELAVDHFCARKTLWFTFPWNDTSLAGARLSRFAVTPDMGAAVSKAHATSGSYIAAQLTPAGYAAQMFKHWRGTVCYELVFVASQYHQGTLRIHYDPGSSNVTNPILQRNLLVNIKETPRVVIRVPFSSSLPKLLTRSGSITAYASAPWYSANGSSINFDPDYHNGSLMVDVVEALTAPVSGTGITVCVYSWVEDMQFSDPSMPDVLDVSLATTTPKVVSHIDPYVLNSNDEVDLGDGTPCNSVLVGGEVISSLRALLGRMVPVDERSFYCTTNQSGVLRYFRILYRYPLAPGRATPINGGGYYQTIWDGPGTNKYPYNFVKFNPITYLTPCFVGWRGSLKWRFVSTRGVESATGGVFSVSRYNRTYEPGADAVANVEACNIYTNAIPQSTGNYYSMALQDTFAMGSSSSHMFMEPVVSIRAPHYSRYSMHPAGAYAMTEPSYILVGATHPSNDADSDCLKVTMSSPAYCDNIRPTGYTSLVAAGEDFSPLIFVNTPTLYIYDAKKPAVGSGMANTIGVVTS